MQEISPVPVWKTLEDGARQQASSKCVKQTHSYINLGLSNELIKVKLQPWKIWKAHTSSSWVQRIVNRMLDYDLVVK